MNEWMNEWMNEYSTCIGWVKQKCRYSVSDSFEDVSDVSLDGTVRLSYVMSVSSSAELSFIPEIQTNNHILLL